ncbi:MAG: hypothetical protein JWP71_3410 [Mucilaginibacter sp.]|nr:hypothetical protein [Mucilaginibacter sp.]
MYCLFNLIAFYFKPPPVFTKDHQIIGKQGVFFRAGVARRRAIFTLRGIAPPVIGLRKNDLCSRIYIYNLLIIINYAF